jgi:hypothetical protein
MSELPPNIVQMLEQYGAFVNDYAPVVAKFYKALRSNGLGDEAAIRITCAWVQGQVSSGEK